MTAEIISFFVLGILLLAGCGCCVVIMVHNRRYGRKQAVLYRDYLNNLPAVNQQSLSRVDYAPVNSAPAASFLIQTTEV
uniref:Uncharacterized protein n=1 Tax=Plectus sambesii TaxID=2011161 RepID=A0A914XFN6_9BILA